MTNHVECYGIVWNYLSHAIVRIEHDNKNRKETAMTMYHKEPRTSSNESATKEDNELAGLTERLTTVSDFSMGPAPPPSPKQLTFSSFCIRNNHFNDILCHLSQSDYPFGLETLLAYSLQPFYRLGNKLCLFSIGKF